MQPATTDVSCFKKIPRINSYTEVEKKGFWGHSCSTNSHICLHGSYSNVNLIKQTIRAFEVRTKKQLQSPSIGNHDFFLQKKRGISSGHRLGAEKWQLKELGALIRSIRRNQRGCSVHLFQIRCEMNKSNVALDLLKLLKRALNETHKNWAKQSLWQFPHTCMAKTAAALRKSGQTPQRLFNILNTNSYTHFTQLFKPRVNHK